MAKLYPPEILEETPHSEREVLNGLRSLDDQYHIFHSTNWFDSEKGEEGEGDIIILNRNRGIIVFEVKGGGIEFRAGEIRQINQQTSTFTIIKDPFKQAGRTKHFLIKKLKNHPSKPRAYVHSAVWFPGGGLIGELPIGIDKKSVFTQNDLLGPSYSIDGLYDHISSFEMYSNNISETQFKEIIELLAPSFSIVRNRKYDFDKRESEFIKLTKEQTRYLDFLESQNKVVIEGSAGTGKSVLALLKAERLAASGEPVLFLCFNKKLREYFKRQGISELVEFHTIHSLMSELTKPIDSSGFDELEENFMSYMMDNSNIWDYRNVIIDEAQDFKNDWLESIEIRTKSTLYIFFDPYQNLYADGIPEVIGGIANKYVLTTNCRNTNQIAQTSSKFVDYEYSEILNQIKGERPKYYESDEIDNTIKLVKNILKSALDSGVEQHDIAVLTMMGEDKSQFSSNIHKIKQVDWTRDLEQNKVMFTTVRKFKGLEAKVLIIVESNLWNLEEDWRKKLLYMAFSRARHELHVINTKHDDEVFQSLLESEGIKSRKPKEEFLRRYGFELG